ELEVGDRVVLGPHGEPVVLGRRRDPARERPRGERPLVLEPKVPMDPPRVMLLDHESGLVLALLRPPAASRLRRSLELPLALVFAELRLRHPPSILRIAQLLIPVRRPPLRGEVEEVRGRLQGPG